MTQADPGNQAPGVLRRMLQTRAQVRLGQGGAPQLPASPPPTPSRAAATAIGRAADRLYQLPVRTLSVQPGALTLAELPELLPELPLVVVLQGPGDLLGAVALCPQAVAALVEWQALGRVTSRGLERRRPTRSDALLCSDFINAMLAELTSEMKGVDGFEGVAGYHFLTHLDDPRPLSLMLEDRPLRSLSFHLAMGAPDMREGHILLALPQPTAQARPRPDAPPTVEPLPPAAIPARISLADAMQDAPVAVTGILCRKRVSLAELRGFLDGRLMSLPRACLTQATLETQDGQILATGKFGEAEGCHAIRLRDPALAGTDDGTASMLGQGVAMMGAHDPGDLSQPDPFRAQGMALDDVGLAMGTDLTVLRG
ncbi:hypothetical protein [Paracoccus sp. Ld10]|uniref:hypothetical protein n=1 Tax=Paracoccus sp. Ld10 TaxID=649158 RepID=UPI0038701A1E